jgi:hypothetical protein
MRKTNKEPGMLLPGHAETDDVRIAGDPLGTWLEARLIQTKGVPSL